MIGLIDFHLGSQGMELLLVIMLSSLGPRKKLSWVMNIRQVCISSFDYFLTLRLNQTEE